MQAEKIIPEAVKKLQETGEIAVNKFEESKEVDADKVVRDQVVDWCSQGVQIITENLEDHEKVKVLSKVFDEVKLSGQAPQEIQWKGSFRQQVDSIFNTFVPRVEQIEFDCEKSIVETAKEFSEKQLVFEKMLQSLEVEQ